MPDPRGPGAQPRTRITSVTVNSVRGDLEVEIRLTRRAGTSPAEPNVTDLPDDAREALAEWLAIGHA